MRGRPRASVQRLAVPAWYLTLYHPHNSAPTPRAAADHGHRRAGVPDHGAGQHRDPAPRRPVRVVGGGMGVRLAGGMTVAGVPRPRVEGPLAGAQRSGRPACGRECLAGVRLAGVAVVSLKRYESMSHPSSLPRLPNTHTLFPLDPNNAATSCGSATPVRATTRSPLPSQPPPLAA